MHYIALFFIHCFWECLGLWMLYIMDKLVSKAIGPEETGRAVLKNRFPLVQTYAV